MVFPDRAQPDRHRPLTGLRYPRDRSDSSPDGRVENPPRPATTQLVPGQ